MEFLGKKFQKIPKIPQKFQKIPKIPLKSLDESV
jgi:hypothetical protein